MTSAAQVDPCWILSIEMTHLLLRVCDVSRVVLFAYVGAGEVQQHKWLVAACAAAGSSADMALNKGALHLSLDPTAVIAVLLEQAGTELSVAPASGAPSASWHCVAHIINDTL